MHKKASKPRRPSAAEDRSETSGPARPLWSGTLSFGLVTVPVELYPASRSNRVSLRMLDAKGMPLSREYFRSGDEEGDSEADDHLDRSEIVRGYPMKDGKIVIVTDDELDALAPKESRDIEVSRFVDPGAIPRTLFERAYLLVPASTNTTAYRLLAKTMEHAKKAAIGTFVMRGKQHLLAILSESGILRAVALRFPDEVRSPQKVFLPDVEEGSKRGIEKMKAAVAKHTHDALSTKELQDSYWQRLTSLAHRKREKGQDVVVPDETPEEEHSGGNVIDLMDALKRSMKGANPPSKVGRSTPARSRRGAPSRDHPRLRASSPAHH